MHIVTKILMVFCAILSLLLAALTMAFAANASAIRGSVAHEQQLRVAAQTELATLQRTQGEGYAAAAQRAQSLFNENQSLNSQIAQLQTDRTRLNSEVERATSEAASIRGQIAQLSATVDTQTKLIAGYREELARLREESLGGERRVIELTDRVNELEGIREVLDQNVRALKEQLEEAKVSLQMAQQSGGTAAGATAARNAPRELPGPLVRARVTEVFPSPAGQTMVVIDEGANRGIRENTQLNVTRSGQWIGTIVITTVEPTRAVGRVDGVSTGQPARDDVVLSRLQ